MKLNSMHKKELAKAQKEMDIAIGKDILELLSHAMYVNPLTIFREYTQNSVDSIDEAESLNLYSKNIVPRIDISISLTNRSVNIIDNGSGIKNQEFKKRITAFGASKKRGSKARGFRGVGRLAGLGYCQELIFRTRAPGESYINEVKWDCKKIAELLRDSTFTGDLKDVVNSVTNFSKVELPDYPEHFFEVELKKVLRLKNDIILNDIEINNYLSQVAPVPFSEDFKFSNKIQEYLDKYSLGKSYFIYLNNSRSPIYKPHQNSICFSENLFDNYKKPKFFEIPGQNGNHSAVGWRLDHSYCGAIPNEAKVKGLRIRSGNIQVGNEDIISHIFPEKRFNAWSVGEIHVLDKKIQPNGRRDNFTQNQSYLNFLSHLAIQTQEISKICRERSKQRNQKKIFDSEKKKVQERLDLLNQPIIPKALATNIKKEIGSSLGIMERLTDVHDLFPNDPLGVKSEFTAIQAEVNKIINSKAHDDPLSKFSTQKKAIYKEIFGLIYECSPSKVNAKSLIDKIINKLSAL